MTALEPAITPTMVQSAPLSEVLAMQTAYRNLCSQLLEDDDFTAIGDKAVCNKSGWRKLAVAFNVSDTIIARDVHRDERGRVFAAEFVVKASTPTRTVEGYGACDIHDRCCDPETCDRWLTYRDSGKPTGHTHCLPDCDGRHAFSNPSHDVPSTAMTRALNRAFSDLFGGEPSRPAGEGGHTRSTAGARRPIRQAPAEVSTDPRPAQDAQLQRIVGLYDQLGRAIPEDEVGKVWTFPEARAKIDELTTALDNRDNQVAGEEPF